VASFAAASALAAARPRADPSALEAGAISAGNSRIPASTRDSPAISLSGKRYRAAPARRVNVNDRVRTLRAYVVSIVESTRTRFGAGHRERVVVETNVGKAQPKSRKRTWHASQSGAPGSLAQIWFASNSKSDLTIRFMHGTTQCCLKHWALM